MAKLLHSRIVMTFHGVEKEINKLKSYIGKAIDTYQHGDVYAQAIYSMACIRETNISASATHMKIELLGWEYHPILSYQIDMFPHICSKLGVKNASIKFFDYINNSAYGNGEYNHMRGFEMVALDKFDFSAVFCKDFAYEYEGKSYQDKADALDAVLKAKIELNRQKMLYFYNQRFHA